jgi:hypothetical protein
MQYNKMLFKVFLFEDVLKNVKQKMEISANDFPQDIEGSTLHGEVSARIYSERCLEFSRGPKMFSKCRIRR